MQSFGKNWWAVSEIFEDERAGGRTNGQGRLLWTPLGKPWVQNDVDGIYLLIPPSKNKAAYKYHLFEKYSALIP